MSDAKKPGGSRDISELKQRLGLKKGQSTTGSTPRVNGGPSGGVVPPPGLNLPPPPGMQTAPTQPLAPPPPNAAEDPFGAMNHMAAVGTVQRAPEMVIVHDGRPVENVGSSSRGSKIAMIAIPGVVALIIGVSIGRASRGADDYNDGVAGASVVLKDEGAFKLALTKVQQQIPTQATKAPAKMPAHPDIKPDKARDAALEKLVASLEIKPNQYTVVRNITADGDIAHQLLEFYAGVEELHSMINAHVAMAKFDDQAYTAGLAAEAAKLKDGENALFAGALRYAVVVNAEEGQQAGVKLVELGPPYCGGRLATSGRCAEGENPSGIAWRADPSAAWQPGDLAPNGEALASKKVVPFIPTGALDALVKTSPASASEILYARRLQTIFDRADQLIQDANKLEGNLQKLTSAGTKFSFFL